MLEHFKKMVEELMDRPLLNFCIIIKHLIVELIVLRFLLLI